MLVDGAWREDARPADHGDRRFRHRIEPAAPGAPPPRFPAEAGRYHLYVAMGCPFAHRTVIYRSLKGLAGVVGLVRVLPVRGAEGWGFGEGHPDPLHGSRWLHELVRRAAARHTGSVTVPMLWDARADAVVNNESGDILRIFDAAFEDLADPDAPLARVRMAPEDRLPAVEEAGAFVHERVATGFFRVGFARGQAAYEDALTALYEALDELDRRLAHRRFLLGDRLTEPDWALFTSLLRWELVYADLFACGFKRLADFPNLEDHTRALFGFPGVAHTVDVEAIKRMYYQGLRDLNPRGIVPLGPVLRLHGPHRRGDWREWLRG